MSFDRIAVLTLIVSIQSSLFDIVQPSTGSCGRCNDAYGAKAGIRVTINAQVCVSYAQKNKNVARFFGKVCPWDAGGKLRPVRKLGLAGPTQKSLRSSWPVLRAAVLTLFESCLHKTVYSMMKPKKRKPESETGRRDGTRMTKRKFCPKWLEEFQWSKFDSTEKQMKCEVCLDAYICKPRSFQNFVHGANNFPELKSNMTSVWY